MNFTAPFISNAGLVDFSENDHYFTIFVTAFSIKGLKVNIPQKMQITNGITIADERGNKITTKIKITKEKIECFLDRWIEPKTYLSVIIKGVKMSLIDDPIFYQVYAVCEDLNGKSKLSPLQTKYHLPEAMPIGTAIIKLGKLKN